MGKGYPYLCPSELEKWAAFISLSHMYSTGGFSAVEDLRIMEISEFRTVQDRVSSDRVFSQTPYDVLDTVGWA